MVLPGFTARVTLYSTVEGYRKDFRDSFGTGSVLKNRKATSGVAPSLVEDPDAGGEFQRGGEFKRESGCRCPCCITVKCGDDGDDCLYCCEKK